MRRPEWRLGNRRTDLPTAASPFLPARQANRAGLRSGAESERDRRVIPVTAPAPDRAYHGVEGETDMRTLYAVYETDHDGSNFHLFLECESATEAMRWMTQLSARGKRVRIRRTRCPIGR